MNYRIEISPLPAVRDARGAGAERQGKQREGYLVARIRFL